MHLLVVDWIRLQPKALKWVSNIWASLVKAFLVIGDWCAWKIGNGKHVQIGLDPWVRENNSWKLASKDLIQDLKEKHSPTINDAFSGLSSGNIEDWKQAQEIGLSSGIENEWTSFLKSLSTVGIKIYESDDTLIWFRDEKRGIPSAKIAYIAFLEDSKDLVSK